MVKDQNKKESAVLVHVDFSTTDTSEDLEEFRELAISAGAHPAIVVNCARRVPSAKYFVGLGKAEEIRDSVTVLKADLVLFNHVLSPAQERNLEKLFQCRVLDRIGLILDIFAQRARTSEGKLQVELAQLQHLSTRLVRGWTHLERQKGGIGLRGPGETQLETDRRLLRDRIKTIKQRLVKVQKHRQQGRQARQKTPVPTVALVGYTNAGKSTLFNQLTGSKVFVADQLFATLDPTMRRIKLPSVGNAVLIDTVGFIRHLPHDLIEAFNATLQETEEASLLLHVVDVHDEAKQAHAEQVKLVLEKIQANQVPTLIVYNKIDLLDNSDPRIDRDSEGKIVRVWVSAAKGIGMELIIQALSELLGRDVLHKMIHLTSSQGRLRALLYEHDVVLSEESDEEGGWTIEVRMPRLDFERWFH
jgi:GTP-binding protein HflX